VRDVHELAGGLWTWTAPHPEWNDDPYSGPDGGTVPNEWLETEWAKATREEYNENLQPLLDLPIELLLPTHGDPVLDDAQTKLRRELS
jgi:hypothetical protein